MKSFIIWLEEVRKPYGYWVLPDGKAITVYSMTGHNDIAVSRGFQDSADAESHGWSRVMVHRIQNEILFDLKKLTSQQKKTIEDIFVMERLPAIVYSHNDRIAEKITTLDDLQKIIGTY
jgi:2-keto-4-pentenoate hydratase